MLQQTKITIFPLPRSSSPVHNVDVSVELEKRRRRLTEKEERKRRSPPPKLHANQSQPPSRKKRVGKVERKKIFSGFFPHFEI